MVRVLPQSQRAEDGVVLVDDSIAVAATVLLIVFGECDKAITVQRGWLRREITEQFRAVVDGPVPISLA